MKVILVSLMTIDGKITKANETDIYNWTSKEDQNFFFSLVAKNNLIVMGSRTYESAKKYMKLGKNQLRIVMTSDPEKYKNDRIPNKIEFINESPEKLTERFKKQKYRQMLVVGGGKINASFFKVGLVDELYLTIEPKIFGKGKPIIAEENLDISLRLVSIKRLNKQGTILLHYSR